jgi:L-amino acid N-acyltransferase YncA
VACEGQNQNAERAALGGIDASNAASLRLHKNLGFEQVAEFRQVGKKFGRWLDLVFVQRFVDG